MAEANGQFGLIGATDYWMEMVKCQHACPVHTDACGYVNAIAEGRYEDAYRIARATNPFASICGRVCGAPCEANCRRGDVDEPVSIRALKRFVTSQFGPETGDYAHYRGVQPRDAAAESRRLRARCGDRRRRLRPDRGARPGHARLQGHRLRSALHTGRHAHRRRSGLPPAARTGEAEIQAILSLGVELKCNMRLGRDFTIAELRAQGYKAIFLGIGLPKGRKLDLPGADLDGVFDGMDFLRAFNEGTPLAAGQAHHRDRRRQRRLRRGALRRAPARALEQSRAVADMERGESVAYDVARSALRLSGDKEVHVVCLERRAEMPADEIEVTEGDEEGIHLHNSRGPREIVGENGKVTGLRTVDARRSSTPTAASIRPSTKPRSRTFRPTPSSSPSARPPTSRSCNPRTASNRTRPDQG